MRRQTGLKVVPREESGKDLSGSGPSIRERAVEAPAVERSIFDTLDNIERFMQNSLTRALGGFAPLGLGSLFDRFSSITTATPMVDIYEEGKHLVVKAELPGIDRNDINVRLLDNSLIISGEKKSERTEGNKEFYRIERSSGSFERSILLPAGVNAEKATASFTNGILEVRIPKGSEEQLGRKITIK
jgi:HSP20 family protein